MEGAPNKKYLYHKVPADLKGNIIHPLNELKDIHPELYSSKLKKYENRDGVMKYLIKDLECKWNDVVHMSPIHPKDLKEALLDAGFQPKEMKFFQIDPEKLDLEKTKVFLFKELRDKKSGKLNDDEIVNFKLEDLDKYSIISEKTKAYYKKIVNNHDNTKMLFAFIHVPHILHKGSIDISNLPIITV